MLAALGVRGDLKWVFKLNNFRIIITVVLSIHLIGCTTIHDASNIVIFLQPLHGVSAGIGVFENHQVRLLDDDGNLYVTYWDIDKETTEVFSERKLACMSDLNVNRIFGKAKPISEIDKSQLKSALYLPLVKCLYGYGYQLVDKDALLPSKFRLSLYRSHSTKDNYMPVGGMYILSKRGASYSDVYTSILRCDKKSKENTNNGAEETYGSGFISVSIEKYADKIQQCLRLEGYFISNEHA